MSDVDEFGNSYAEAEREYFSLLEWLAERHCSECAGYGYVFLPFGEDGVVVPCTTCVEE